MAFKEFKLRKQVELNALKIYFLIAALRDNQENVARVSYKKISEYTGVSEGSIRSALTFLVHCQLIHIDNDPLKEKVSEERKLQDYSAYEDVTRSLNIYRLVHVEPYIHRGTHNRNSLGFLPQVNTVAAI